MSKSMEDNATDRIPLAIQKVSFQSSVDEERTIFVNQHRKSIIKSRLILILSNVGIVGFIVLIAFLQLSHIGQKWSITLSLVFWLAVVCFFSLARNYLSSLSFGIFRYKQTLLWFDDLIHRSNAVEDEFALEKLKYELQYGRPEFFR